MASPSKFVRFQDDRAELALGKEIVERSGLRPGEELSVFAPGGSLLLLERAQGRKGSFVGRLETLSVGEIFGLVTSAIRSGTLVIQSLGDRRRRIVFEEGQVLSAASTDLSERLGPVLWRKGLVALEQLQEWEPKVSAGVKLGKLLVDAGVLTPAQLYRGFQQQVREIVLGAFLETEGDFAFLEGECNELNTVKLPERTRELVLEGITRAERMEHLRQSYDLGAPPARIATPGGAPQGVEQLAVWEKIDGRRSLRDVVRASRLGEYSALVAFAELVRAKLVRQAAPSRPATTEPPRPANVGGPQQRYAAALWRIRQELETEGAGQRLESFFAELEGEPRQLFEGVRQEGGGFDLEVLFANAQRLRKGPMGRAVALEALDSLVSFALFDARNVLPGGRADELSHDVLRMLRGA